MDHSTLSSDHISSSHVAESATIIRNLIMDAIEMISRNQRFVSLSQLSQQVTYPLIRQALFDSLTVQFYNIDQYVETI